MNANEPKQKISVLVTTLNSSTLPKCLSALEQNTDDIYELIIVADEPTKEHWRILRRWADKGATLLVNPERLGSEVATNQGFRIARGNYVALVTSDVYVERGWLPPLVAALDKHPEFGWVACRAEEAGKEIDFLGGCSLFSRDLFDKIGLFDEAFSSGYGFSDDEFYHRALRFGFRPCSVREAFVKHPHGASTVGKRTTVADDFKKNQHLLYQKLGVAGTHWDELPVYSLGSDSLSMKFDSFVRDKQ